MIAFVFPGQGSQSIGMLNDLADLKVVQDTLAEASDALGLDLLSMMKNGPIEDLNLTVNTQPVMLTASVAFYRAWLDAGGQAPVMMAGHSLGEYSALTAAGVLTLTDAVKLVRTRAEAMQSAVPVGVGGMAAILGIDDDTVKFVCETAQAEVAGEVVQAVNFNSPGQVVIAGHKTAVEKACELAKAAGAKRALILPVSAPFHSSLLKPAADVLQNALNNVSLNAPNIPVINNVDVMIEHDIARIKDALVRQAWHPVRWVECVQAMADKGVTDIVECGPGKVLAGLAKRIDARVTGHALVDQASLKSILEALN
ncbi:Malonyl CoA-acyl carrier protein transacylase [Ephemeroptericola cinctiostellae]|uniref:Malonyl CoA-acyl carrier protein transacylase n=1 Tax=Ephemeroptericola cinctiostellae TaxID=2268024 RepID=A0A345DBP8_9BURK|nr:ACP S-malonyltransferase [Ephemeroptericola cinctiostellae]AXF85786.1 Malonyl CoA-acyl carrier protein transacylase [Ephemeroptericola cinctiostellae]